MKISHTRIAVVVIAAITASAVAITQSPESRYLEIASGEMAGNCQDCVEGGKSCDKSNAADGITEGAVCSSVGSSVQKNCGGEKGLVQKASKNSADVGAEADGGTCPAATKAYECWDPDGAGSQQGQWRQTSATCGSKALCDAQNRVVNDPACKDTKVD